MNNLGLERWLTERNIVLEEDFATALEGYIKECKKKQSVRNKGYLCPFGGQSAGCL